MANTGQTADTEMLKSALARIQNLEESLSSLKNKVRDLEKDKQTTTPTVAAHEKKLKTVIQDVADLVPKVSHLENQIQQTITPTVAVTAYVEEFDPEEGKIIKKWTGNTGGHFDIKTGIFTAPVAGTYAVALSMHQVVKGKIGLYIKQNKTSSGSDPNVDDDETVAKAITDITDRDDSTSCDFSMVDMSVRDKLYVCVWEFEEIAILAECKFSIFLVK